MRWNGKEIDQALQEKEYIDSVVLPLIPVAWGNDTKSTVNSGEFTAVIVEELERQLRGRLILFPSFTYLKSAGGEASFERLQAWINEMLEHGIKHVFCLTSDVDWKAMEEKMKETLIWLPALPLEHMDATYRQEMITSQVKQLLKIITKKWQNGYNSE